MIIIFLLPSVLAIHGIGIDISHCGMNISVFREYLLLKGPNSEDVIQTRKYMIKDITTLKLVEGNYIHDYPDDIFLRQFLWLHPFDHSEVDKKTPNYLYFISPSFLYMSEDRKTYDPNCLRIVRNVLFPLVRKFWLLYHQKNSDEFELTAKELNIMANFK